MVLWVLSKTTFEPPGGLRRLASIRQGRDMPTNQRQHTIIDRFPHKGQEYRCGIHEDMAWPIIRSHQTGKEIVFKWRDLVSLARLKGIDLEEEPQQKGREAANGD